MQDGVMQVYRVHERLIVKVGDITREAVDAIVNAANASLLGGGGVDGAIHRAGGPEILRACREIRATTHPEGLPTGDAVITPGGRLPAAFVIHTVGPVYGEHGGREPELLAACYENALDLAASRALRSLAFPAISTGVYGYPLEQAAEVAIESTAGALAEHPSVEEARFWLFGDAAYEAFQAAHARYCSGSSSA